MNIIFEICVGYSFSFENCASSSHSHWKTFFDGIGRLLTFCIVSIFIFVMRSEKVDFLCGQVRLTGWKWLGWNEDR